MHICTRVRVHAPVVVVAAAVVVVVVVAARLLVLVLLLLLRREGHLLSLVGRLGQLHYVLCDDG